MESAASGGTENDGRHSETFKQRFWKLSCSRRDASKFREIPFNHHKAAVYPWESWSKFLVAGCPSSHQPTRIREETLESGGPLQRKLNFRLRTNLL